jgi:H+-transporting ATPase
MTQPSRAGGGAPPEAAPDLATAPLDVVQQQLDTTGDGLSSDDAARRLDEVGPNELAEHRRSLLVTFLSYFWAPIPWMIEVALVLSAVARHWADTIIIGVLLVMNGVVAFWEEHQAANAVEALRDRLARDVTARRDGAWTSVPTGDLVPGDVVHVRIGDVIPADARVLGDGALQLDQSALTGESLPVDAARGAVAYSGSVVARGDGDLLVFATGAQSFYGRTTTLVDEAGAASHFQRAVLRIGNYLIVLALALLSIVIAVSLARGDGTLETLTFALVVAVAAIPVALPAVLSVTMAVGAAALARREAVVTHLPAVEELGGIDVLCCDKTGTLTRNALTAGAPEVLDPASTPEQVLTAAALASRAQDHDPIDDAVLAAAPPPDPAVRVLRYVPFEPASKRSEASLGDHAGRRWKVTKGAPQVVGALCGRADDPRLFDAVQEFATRGSRSIAVARDDGGGWQLLGVLPLSDPPRDDSAATIDEAEALGVEIKMVTGDQLAIAHEIASQVGIGDRVIDARELDDGTRTGDDASLLDVVARADGFAQVLPEHKYRIVRALQSDGHIVGMTGDGVNDAPALKQADAGIAVSGATDAARAAADLVLLAPGLSVIVEAIRQSREIFERMTSYAIYRIAETIRVLLLISVSIVVFSFFPVTPVMIVLLALLNDGAILSIAYDNATAAPHPVRWQMRDVLAIATALGLIGVVASFGLFAYTHKVLDLGDDKVRALMYLKLSVAGHLTIFVTRTRDRFWRSRPAPILVAAVVGTQLVATLIAVYGIFMTAIGWGAAALVWCYALAWMFVNDEVKILTVRWLRAHPAKSAVPTASHPGPAT